RRCRHSHKPPPEQRGDQWVSASGASTPPRSWLGSRSAFRSPGAFGSPCRTRWCCSADPDLLSAPANGDRTRVNSASPPLVSGVIIIPRSPLTRISFGQELQKRVRPDRNLPGERPVVGGDQ